MAQKPHLLIGGCHGYNWEQLAPWVMSAKAVSDCDIALVASNIDGRTVSKLAEVGVQVAVHEHNGRIAPHVERFIYIHEYLYSNPGYDFVLMTDVKDVAFQSDPFQMLRVCGANLLCGSEGLRYRDEPWGDNNLRQTFGDHLWNRWRDWEIFNVGVIAGAYSDIVCLTLQLFLTSINRAIPICDQAVFNYLYNYTGLGYSVHASQPEEDWVCHAGTLADPTKIEKFRPHLLYKEPIFKDGKVCTYDGFPFAIVHQYDRVPGWKQMDALRHVNDGNTPSPAPAE